MGFRIEVEGGWETKAFLRRLMKSPTDVFPAPFCGYMLFLFTGREESLVEQFKKQMHDLDSLTGETIAFAFFVERYAMTVVEAGLERRSTKRIISPNTKLAEFNVRELDVYSIDRLVKRGRVGWVEVGDKLVAVTDATNKIATELGVLASLPCLIIFDGCPDERFEVVHLTSDILEDLVPILRISISRLRQSVNFETYMSMLKAVSDTEKLRQESEAKIRKALLSLQDLEAFPNSLHNYLLNTITSKVRKSGKVSSIKECLSDYMSSVRFTSSRLSSEERYEILKNIVKNCEMNVRDLHRVYFTIENLSKFETMPWPLNQRDEKFLRQLNDVYVSPHLNNNPGNWEPSIEYLRLTIERLREISETKSVELCNLIEKILFEKIMKAGEMSKAEAELQLSVLRSQAAEQAHASLAAISSLNSSHRKLGVSFSDVFVEEIRRRRRGTVIKSSQNGLIRILLPWLRPEALPALFQEATRLLS